MSRTKLMAVLAAAVFTTSTAVAHADGMSAGTWDGKITGGTLSLGDGAYSAANGQAITVPGGDPFTFTIPAGASAPVAFKAPATHIAVPLVKVSDSGTQWAVAGHVDVSPITGTVDPATGAVTGSATAHGLLHLDLSSPSGPSSLYCHLGDPPASAADPAPPAPFGINLTGDTTLTAALAITLDCGVPIAPTALPIIGTPALPGSNITLTATFTRRPDPTPPPTTTVKPPASAPKTSNPPKTFTPVEVKCVVPKLKGLKLSKARKAAKKANCAVTVKRKKSAKKPSTVLKQAKRAGTVLAKGSKITITVAKK